MPSKQQLYDFCKAFADNRMGRLQTNVRDIQDSLLSETKSSAGDKHETGRAMLQLEREKLGQQLAEAEKMRQFLSKVVLERNSTSVGLGSWVQTSKADYFLAISAGMYKGPDSSVYCISAETPIGKLLIGKFAGDTFVFKNEEIKILKVE